MKKIQKLIAVVTVSTMLITSSSMAVERLKTKGSIGATFSKASESAKNGTVIVTEDTASEIERSVRSTISIESRDYNMVTLKGVEVNLNISYDDDNHYLVIIRFSWNDENKPHTIRKNADYLCDAIAVSLAADSRITGLTCIWDAPKATSKSPAGKKQYMFENNKAYIKDVTGIMNE